MNKKLNYRFEMKHKITEADVLALKSRLYPIMKKDENASKDGKYLIRSLYFDTPEDKALLDKLNGVAIREKFRIRFYNNNCSYIRLEKKIKRYNMTSKLSTNLTKKEVINILNNDIEFLKESTNCLLREFYLKLKCERLEAKSIVDYNREAFIYPVGNVRVTIDSDIKTSVNSIDLFNKDLPTVSVIDENMTVLEVKYDEFIPDFIKDLIQINKTTSTAVSKYASSRLYI